MTTIVFFALQMESKSCVDLLRIGAENSRTSNWLRYVNCARHPEELNVRTRKCYGKMFYETNRDVSAGEELLVYYGRGYAKRLGIDASLFVSAEDEDLL